MSVSTTTTSVSITGDGATTDISVTYPFKGTGSAAELTVVERTIATGVEVTKAYTTHYTVTGGGGATGTVIAVTAPASTVEWHVRRNTTNTQITDYVTNDPLPANTIEGDFDRAVMINQEQAADIAQAFKFPDTYGGGASTVVPEPVGSSFLKWNAVGTALENSTTSAAQYLGGNGTVALPFYSFSADPDSGIYRIGANNVGLAVNAAKVLDIATTGLTVTGVLTGGTLEATSDTSAADPAAVGYTAAEGVILTGQGSTNDVTIKNDADAAVIEIPTGTTNVDIVGTATAAAFEPDGDTSAGDNAAIGYSASEGLILTGQGSANDVTIKNDADAEVLSVPTGTLNLTAAGDLTIAGDLTVNGTTVTLSITNQVIADNLIELNNGATSNANDAGVVIERGSTGDNALLVWDESGDFWAVGTTAATGSATGNITYTFADFWAGVITGTTVEATADTSAGDNAAMGYTAAEGLILTGQGSTNDVTIKNDADADVITIPTGTTNVDIVGVATAASFEPDGDTTAGDAAAIGYTAAEGLILTGQGSTNDVTIKNDADADVMVIATGTTVADFKGSIKLATGATVTGIDNGVISTGSATLLATQGAINTAINAGIKAPGVQMLWETTTTDTDQGAGKVWTNNATLSSATVLYFDDVEASGVSINALIDSLDDPTATNSATIYIQEAGNGTAGVLFQVSGAVTSASTYSKVAVTHVATFGTLVDGDTVGVVLAFSGNNGGGGDLLAANNLSDVASAPTALSNLGGVGIGLTLALGG
jgi:hypothetical protein